jgi:hypothetical protein
MRPTLGSTLRGLARAGRVWLLGLALAVVAAHSLAAWHLYSHDLAEAAAQSSGKKPAASEVCVICIAIAGIGGGAPAQPTWQPERFAHEAPLPVRPAVPHLAPQPRPYAIRAPPILTA